MAISAKYSRAPTIALLVLLVLGWLGKNRLVTGGGRESTCLAIEATEGRERLRLLVGQDVRVHAGQGEEAVIVSLSRALTLSVPAHAARHAENDVENCNVIPNSQCCRVLVTIPISDKLKGGRVHHWLNLLGKNTRINLACAALCTPLEVRGPISAVPPRYRPGHPTLGERTDGYTWRREQVRPTYIFTFHRRLLHMHATTTKCPCNVPRTVSLSLSHVCKKSPRPRGSARSDCS